MITSCHYIVCHETSGILSVELFANRIKKIWQSRTV